MDTLWFITNAENTKNNLPSDSKFFNNIYKYDNKEDFYHKNNEEWDRYLRLGALTIESISGDNNSTSKNRMILISHVKCDSEGKRFNDIESIIYKSKKEEYLEFKKIPIVFHYQ